MSMKNSDDTIGNRTCDLQQRAKIYFDQYVFVELCIRETSESFCFVSCKRDPGERALGTFNLTGGDSLFQFLRHPVCDVYHKQCFSCTDTWIMNMTAQAERYRNTTMEHTCQIFSVPNYKTGHSSVSAKYIEYYETVPHYQIMPPVPHTTRFEAVHFSAIKSF